MRQFVQEIPNLAEILDSTEANLNHRHILCSS